MTKLKPRRKADSDGRDAEDGIGRWYHNFVTSNPALPAQNAPVVARLSYRKRHRCHRRHELECRAPALKKGDVLF
jgi:hypothetical protein